MDTSSTNATRLPFHRRSFLATLASAGVVGVGAPAVVAASRGAESIKLEALGKAWTANLTQQKAAEAACKNAANPAAYKAADALWSELMTEEVELTHAIQAEPANSSDELALKSRVILREIGLTPTGNTLSGDPTSIDWSDLDLGQSIAASLALDLIRLAAEEA